MFTWYIIGSVSSPACGTAMFVDRCRWKMQNSAELADSEHSRRACCRNCRLSRSIQRDRQQVCIVSFVLFWWNCCENRCQLYCVLLWFTFVTQAVNPVPQVLLLTSALRFMRRCYSCSRQCYLHVSQLYQQVFFCLKFSIIPKYTLVY